MFITLTEFNAGQTQHQYTLEHHEYRPSGLKIVFNKGRDERTRRPIRYRAELYPATQQGSWTLTSDEEQTGLIENVRSVSKEVVTGIWCENGLRYAMRIDLVEPKSPPPLSSAPAPSPTSG